MSNVLTHRFTSPKLDGADATQIQPSAWNDGHRFIGGADGDVLTRATADATYGAVWAPPAGWVAYTPTWWVNGVVNPLGAHQWLRPAYHRRGDAVWYQILLLTGATAIPAGNWAFSTPTTHQGMLSSGTGLLRFGTTEYPLFPSHANMTDRCVLRIMTTNFLLTDLTATVPVTVSSGTLVEIRGTYQV